VNLELLNYPRIGGILTISHDLEKAKHTLRLIKFNDHAKRKNSLSSLPKSDHWDVKRGDYRVKEDRTKPVYFNSEYKKVFAFAHFSITIIITIATVVLILSQIAKV